MVLLFFDAPLLLVLQAHAAPANNASIDARIGLG
jgi:hypothetical protein